MIGLLFGIVMSLVLKFGFGATGVEMVFATWITMLYFELIDIKTMLRTK